MKNSDSFIDKEVAQDLPVLKFQKSKKKVRKTWKKRNFQKMRARYELKKRRRRQQWLEKGRTRKDGKLFARKPKQYQVVAAPKNFSLIQNTEEVLAFFKTCGKMFSDRKQVIFDLSGIENLTPDTIALLVAKVKDRSYTHELEVMGNNPSREDLKKIFISSGFLDHVKTGFVSRSQDKNLLIHKITDKKVENDVAKSICEVAVSHTFNKDIKFRPLFEIIIECMANTNNHAGLEKQGTYNWWILVYCDPKSMVTSFAFLDLGVGILGSLPIKNHIRKLLTGLQNKVNIDLVRKFNYAELVPKLFSGEIFLTRTEQKDRGQGLPLIYNHSKNAQIKNFTIISNDIFIKIPTLDFKKMRNKFHGTLLYWELHPEVLK